MEIERATAAIFGVEFHLPDLAQRVGLNEMPLVVHMESMIDGMVLQIGHVSGHVDDCHTTKLPAGVATADGGVLR